MENTVYWGCVHRRARSSSRISRACASASSAACLATVRSAAAWRASVTSVDVTTYPLHGWVAHRLPPHDQMARCDQIEMKHTPTGGVCVPLIYQWKIRRAQATSKKSTRLVPIPIASRSSSRTSITRVLCNSQVPSGDQTITPCSITFMIWVASIRSPVSSQRMSCQDTGAPVWIFSCFDILVPCR
jgi:hypothetical protein